MYGGPVEKMNILVAGTIIERVEPATGAESGGQFTMVCRRPRPDGKPGKPFHIRVCGADVGWWFNHRQGTNGEWEEYG